MVTIGGCARPTSQQRPSASLLVRCPRSPVTLLHRFCPTHRHQAVTAIARNAYLPHHTHLGRRAAKRTGRSLAPADHTDRIRCLGARQLPDHAHSLLIDWERAERSGRWWSGCCGRTTADARTHRQLAPSGRACRLISSPATASRNAPTRCRLGGPNPGIAPFRLESPSRNRP
jgi:hypothetical protein